MLAVFVATAQETEDPLREVVAGAGFDRVSPPLPPPEDFPEEPERPAGEGSGPLEGTGAVHVEVPHREVAGRPEAVEGVPPAVPSLVVPPSPIPEDPSVPFVLTVIDVASRLGAPGVQVGDLALPLADDGVPPDLEAGDGPWAALMEHYPEGTPLILVDGDLEVARLDFVLDPDEEAPDLVLRLTTEGVEVVAKRPHREVPLPVAPPPPPARPAPAGVKGPWIIGTILALGLAVVARLRGRKRRRRR